MTKKDKEKFIQILNKILYGATEIFEANNMKCKKDYLTGMISEFLSGENFATITLKIKGNKKIIGQLKNIGWEKDEEYLACGDLLYEDESGQYDRRIVLKKLIKDL